MLVVEKLAFHLSVFLRWISSEFHAFRREVAYDRIGQRKCTPTIREEKRLTELSTTYTVHQLPGVKQTEILAVNSSIG